MNAKFPFAARRKFLKAAGGIAVGLPFLESLVPRAAHAAAPASRFVVLYTPCGTNNFSLFMPQGVGANFTLGTESAPVLPFKNKLLALSGIDMLSADAGDVGDQHAVGMGHMLTCKSYEVDPKLVQAEDNTDYPVGFANGISVDQQIATAVGASSRYKSLEFGVQTSVRYGNHPFSRMVYAGPTQPVSPEDSPLAAYNRLFSGVTAAPIVPGMLDANLARRRSVIDYVIKEFESVNAAVPASDKVRLDQHLSMIREVERGLASGAAAGPVSCSQAVGYMPLADHLLHANFPAVGKQQADLLVLALACGLTRVASLQYSYARSLERLEWIDTAGCGACGSITEDHHTISHNGGDPTSDAQMAWINRWYAEQVAYLIGKMDSVNEGGSTLLDNSMAFWCSEVSYASDHSYHNIRAFIFGSGGGKIKTGQHIAFTSQPHNKLHVTFMNAMGMPVASFGDTGFGDGPLAGVLA
ncbi:MAG: DUF1552 domain-containing protein [Polyangiaceae bacterium]|nr:DUF1552 domain-containing protein [Polyangiaceae bacterium]